MRTLFTLGRPRHHRRHTPDFAMPSARGATPNPTRVPVASTAALTASESRERPSDDPEGGRTSSLAEATPGIERGPNPAPTRT